MITYEDLIKALQIFMKYDHIGTRGLFPGRDYHGDNAMWAGPHPESVSEEDEEELDGLGWRPDYDEMCFSWYGGRVRKGS